MVCAKNMAGFLDYQIVKKNRLENGIIALSQDVIAIFQKSAQIPIANAIVLKCALIQIVHVRGKRAVQLKIVIVGFRKSILNNV